MTALFCYIIKTEIEYTLLFIQNGMNNVIFIPQFFVKNKKYCSFMAFCWHGIKISSHKTEISCDGTVVLCEEIFLKLHFIFPVCIFSVRTGNKTSMESSKEIMCFD